MSIIVTPDHRFDKPSLDSLLELLKQQRYVTLNPSHVVILNVSAYVGPELTTEQVIEQTTFDTQLRLRLSVPEKAPEELTFLYSRLLLSAFLYRHIVVPQQLKVPALLIDRFETTVDTYAVDALAYLKSEYKVQLSLDECGIASRHASPHLDGTWDVIITPNVNHPVWVGPVVLTAYNGVP